MPASRHPVLRQAQKPPGKTWTQSRQRPGAKPSPNARHPPSDTLSGGAREKTQASLVAVDFVATLGLIALLNAAGLSLGTSVTSWTGIASAVITAALRSPCSEPWERTTR